MNGIDLLQWVQRVQTLGVTAIVRRSFRHFGPRSRIVPPCRISGAEYIDVGSDVYLHANCWLEAISQHEKGGGTILRIGDRTQVSGQVVISSACSVLIGEDVTLARGVFITDHNHQADDSSIPISLQGITSPRPVTIGAGSWLGHNVVVLPGVHIGANVVVGANSVVTRDVDPFSVVVGSPARPIEYR